MLEYMKALHQVEGSAGRKDDNAGWRDDKARDDVKCIRMVFPTELGADRHQVETQGEAPMEVSQDKTLQTVNVMLKLMEGMQAARRR